MSSGAPNQTQRMREPLEKYAKARFDTSEEEAKFSWQDASVNDMHGIEADHLCRLEQGSQISILQEALLDMIHAVSLLQKLEFGLA